MNDSSRAAKVAETVFTKVAVLCMAFVGSVVVSRVLGPDGRGAYYVIVSLAMTALSLGHLSISSSVVVLRSEVKQPERLYGAAVALGVVTGLAASGLAWAITQFLWPSAIPVASMTALAVALVAVPAGTVVINLNSLHLVDDRVARVNVGLLLAAAVQTGGLLALAANDRVTLTSVVVLWSLNTATPLVPLLWRTPLRMHGVGQLALRMLRVGARFHLGLAMAFLLFRVDIFLLNARVSPQEVGLYSLAVSLVEMTSILTESVVQVTVHKQASAPMAAVGEYTARVARTSLLLAAAGIGGLLVLGPLLVPVIFGSEFGPATGAIAALAPGIVALAVVRPIGPFVTRQNRPLLVVGAYVSTLLINIGLNVVLIPRAGIVGAGIASSVAYIVLAVLGAAWLVRSAGLPVSSLVPRVSDIKVPLAALRSYRPGWIGRT